MRSDKDTVNARASDDPAGDSPAPERHRLLVGIVTVHLLWFEAVYPQRAHGVFGASVSIPLAKTPAGLMISATAAGPELDLVTNDPPGVDAYALTDRGGLEYRSTARLKVRCRSWAAAIVDPQGTQALVGLTASSDTLVLARRRSASVFDEIHIPLETRPQQFLL